jgi:hypothetical protein
MVNRLEVLYAMPASTPEQATSWMNEQMPDVN